jgi:hypothetical protein
LAPLAERPALPFSRESELGRTIFFVGLLLRACGSGNFMKNPVNKLRREAEPAAGFFDAAVGKGQTTKNDRLSYEKAQYRLIVGV